MAWWHANNRGTPEGKEREKVRNRARYRPRPAATTAPRKKRPRLPGRPPRSDRERYVDEADHRRAYQRAYYWKNREREIQRSRQYRKDHQDRRRSQRDLRHKRMVENPGYCPFTDADWQKLIRQYGGACAYCRRAGPKLHKDHVVPLSRGGRHAIANILPACKSCNAKKASLLLSEWRYKTKRR